MLFTTYYYPRKHRCWPRETISSVKLAHLNPNPNSDPDLNANPNPNADPNPNPNPRPSPSLNRYLPRQVTWG